MIGEILLWALYVAGAVVVLTWLIMIFGIGYVTVVEKFQDWKQYR